MPGPTRRRLRLLAVVVALLASGTAAVAATPPPYLHQGLVPSAQVGVLNDLTAGPDGAMWIGTGNHRIVRVGVDGVFTEYWAGGYHTGAVDAITMGPDGRLWFVEPSRNLIGAFNPVTTGTAEYSAGNARTSDMWDITTGPDGALWFTDRDGDRIGRITTEGALRQFAELGVHPEMITAGGDGRLWFTCQDGMSICRMTTEGALRVFPIPFDHAGRISSITTGADGNVWFADQAGGIWRITPAGATTVFPVPGPGDPTGITAGPDGNLWFTHVSFTRFSIGSMTTGGDLRGLATIGQPVDASVLPGFAIAPGPDGRVWWIGPYDDIGRISSAMEWGAFPSRAVLGPGAQDGLAAAVTVPVACPSATVNPCQGTLTLTGIGPEGGYRLVGRGSFTARPGERVTIRVPFTPRAKRQFARQGYLAVILNGSMPPWGPGEFQRLVARRAGATVPREISVLVRTRDGVSCRVQDGPWKAGILCRDSGRTASARIDRDGHVRTCAGVACAPGLGRPRPIRRLRPGAPVRTSRFVCAAGRSGITCRHRKTGHGFRLTPGGVLRVP